MHEPPAGVLSDGVESCAGIPNRLWNTQKEVAKIRSASWKKHSIPEYKVYSSVLNQNQLKITNYTPTRRASILRAKDKDVGISTIITVVKRNPKVGRLWDRWYTIRGSNDQSARKKNEKERKTGSHQCKPSNNFLSNLINYRTCIRLVERYTIFGGSFKAIAKCKIRAPLARGFLLLCPKFSRPSDFRFKRLFLCIGHAGHPQIVVLKTAVFHYGMI